MTGIIEKIYSISPVFVQNIGVSVFGLYWRHERFGAEFKRCAADFAQRDRWSVERMNAYIDGQVRDVIARALETPHYREAWSDAGVRSGEVRTFSRSDLWRLPIVGKSQLRRDPTRFIPTPFRSRRRLRREATSGSTGTPISVYMTRESRQRFAAAREVRSFGWAGVSVHLPRAMVGGRPVLPKGKAVAPFHRYNSIERQVYFSAYHISPDTISDYAQAICRHRPEVFTGYAFSQFLIAKLMLENSCASVDCLRAAITSSEMLTPAMRATIRVAWGCRCYEEYGSVENCGLATECEYGSLHVNTDFGIIELLDEEGTPVPPGVEGRVVCTGFLNDAQVLVRYDIGDMAKWSGKLCRCGRKHLPVLEGITGRLEDVVVGPDGRQLVRFHGIFVDVSHVMEGQIIQEAVDDICVRVVVDLGFGEEQEREICQRVRRQLGDVRVRVEQVAELERGSSGKIRAVISRVARGGGAIVEA